MHTQLTPSRLRLALAELMRLDREIDDLHRRELDDSQRYLLSTLRSCRTYVASRVPREVRSEPFSLS